MGMGKKQTVGYKYYVGMHQVYAMSPRDFPVQEVSRIRVGEQTVWTGALSANGTAEINAPEAFGGEKKEGGVSGNVDVMFGGATQGVNSYLAGKLSGFPLPAFRGVLSLVLRQCYVAAMNPYLKTWAVFARRNVAPWYPTKSAIGVDMNPAHIVRDALTNTQYGLAVSQVRIDDASFTAAADTLHAEGMGLSAFWQTSAQSAEDFIGSIAEIVDASVYEDQASGKWVMRLSRDNYTVANLLVLDRSNIARVERFSQPLPGDLTSEVVLTYRDRETGTQASVMAHDIAVLAMQAGAPVRATIDMPAIPTAEIAAKVAARELRQLSASLARADIIANRQAWDLNIGDVFRWQWPDYGITEMVMRVVSVGRGRLTDGRIRLQCVQDIFSAASAVYAAPAASGWSPPLSAPAASPNRIMIEAPYWVLVRDVIGEFPSLFADLDPAAGLLLAAASRPSGDAYDYRLLTRVGTAAYADRGSGTWCPVADLAASVGPGDSVFQIAAAVDEDLIAAGDTAWAIIDAELVRVVSAAAGSVTVSRGVLDTVPASHAGGAKIYFVGTESYGIDTTEWLSGQSVSAKLLTRTGLGTLLEASAPADSRLMAARYIRPYPPGNVAINSVAWPESVTGDLNITWAHRDRTLQTAYLVAQNEASIGPETGTTYTIRIYNAQTGGTLIRTYTGVTGTTQAYTAAQATTDNAGVKPANLRIEIESARAGYVSWQQQVRAFAWA